MEYDNNLTGALFNENKSDVIKRGNFMINGVMILHYNTYAN